VQREDRPDPRAIEDPHQKLATVDLGHAVLPSALAAPPRDASRKAVLAPTGPERWGLSRSPARSLTTWIRTARAWRRDRRAVTSMPDASAARYCRTFTIRTILGSATCRMITRPERVLEVEGSGESRADPKKLPGGDWQYRSTRTLPSPLRRRRQAGGDGRRSAARRTPRDRILRLRDLYRKQWTWIASPRAPTTPIAAISAAPGTSMSRTASSGARNRSRPTSRPTRPSLISIPAAAKKGLLQRSHV